MRKFDVALIHRDRLVSYKDLDGKKAIKLMKSLKPRGFATIAITNSCGYTELLTLKEMENIVI